LISSKRIVTGKRGQGAKKKGDGKRIFIAKKLRTIGLEVNFLSQSSGRETMGGCGTKFYRDFQSQRRKKFPLQRHQRLRRERKENGFFQTRMEPLILENVMGGVTKSCNQKGGGLALVKTSNEKDIHWSTIPRKRKLFSEGNVITNRAGTSDKGTVCGGKESL